MNGLPAPNTVLSLLSCDCKRRCVEGKCACMVNGIKCTDMCSLKTCDNQPLGGVVDEEGDQDKMKETLMKMRMMKTLSSTLTSLLLL